MSEDYKTGVSLDGFNEWWTDDDEEDDDSIPCVCCSCLIGDEVGYGDDWGEGPMCENCIRPWREDRSS